MLALIVLAACAPGPDERPAHRTRDTASATTDRPTDEPPVTHETGATGTTDPGASTTADTGGPPFVLDLVPAPCADPTRRQLRRFDAVDLPTTVPAAVAMQAGGLVAADLDADPALELIRLADRRVERWDLTAGGWTSTVLDVPVQDWMAASTADIDGDGDLDLALGGFDAPPALLRNDGGAFTDVTAASGLATAAHQIAGLAWLDWNQDGVLDLATAAYGALPVLPDNPHPSRIYLGRGDGTFLERAPSLPAAARDAYTFTFGTFDIDGDGATDLLMANDFPAFAPSALLLYRAPAFVPAPEAAFGAGRDGMGLAHADLNADGWPDLAVTSIGATAVYTSVAAPDTDAGVVWVERAAELGIDSGDRQFGWGAAFGDLDNDADEDLVLVYGDWNPIDVPDGPVVPHPDQAFEQDDAGAWVDRSAAWGLDDPRQGRALTLVDLDRDGWLDPAVAVLDGATAVHTARCGDAGWLTIRLRDHTRPNTHAVGAVVEVATDRAQRRWITAGSSSLFAGMQPEAHVGLSTATRATITVRWPDGTVSVHADVPSRHHVTVHRTRS